MYHIKHRTSIIAAFAFLAAITIFMSAPTLAQAQGIYQYTIKRWLCSHGFTTVRYGNGAVVYWYYEDWCSISFQPSTGRYPEYYDQYWWYSYTGFGPWYSCPPCTAEYFLGYVSGINV